jgi:hypothetical protein
VIPTALLADEVTVESYEGAGAHGPIFDPTPSQVRARIEPRRSVVRRGDGTEVISRAVMFARPDAAIAAEDRVSSDGRTYRVLDIATRKAGSSSTYLEVMLG